MSTAAKFNYLQQHWFTAKKEKNDKKSISMVPKQVDVEYIMCDSVVTLKCVHGKAESIEHFQVLALHSS
jgi:hypothetical protein